ncbi:MAG TPA: protein kinase [Gemmatimonadaceae bacterium]
MTDPARGTDELAPNLWPAELDPEYINLGELGRGGMAVVFRARDRELGRDVAIKVVKPRFSADDEAVARLVREAKTVAQLQHPNIVALHGLKHLSDRSVALVMQLVPGRTLKSAIAQGGPLDPRRAEQILADIARALAFAHKVGVVHRDVKPENIFLDDISGRALLSDFGVARAMDASNELTATGTTIGTPTYMPPEQIDGLEVDGRSDLYSLGMVAWEMLTGQRPWAGESLYGVIYRQKHDPLPPIDSYRKDVEPRLLYLIEGLMQKRPDKRWSSAARFLALLSSNEEPPGLHDWMVLRQRQRRAPATPRSLPYDGAPPTQETMRFVRGQPVGVPPPAEGIVPPGVYPEPEPEHEFPGDPVEQEVPEPVPEERSPRWVALALVAAIVAVGGWLGWRTFVNPPSVLDTGVPMVVMEDRRSVDVPLNDSARPAEGGEALSGVPPIPDSVIDTARAFLAWLAMQNAERAAAAQRDSSFTAAVGGSRTGTTSPTQATTPRETAPPPTSRAPTTQSQRPDANEPPPASSSGGNVRSERTGVVTAPPVTLTPPAEPAAPAFTVPAEQRPIASGARHSCRLRADGRAECWGNNDAGQLGDGSFDGHAVAAPIAGSFRFTQLAAGFSHTCGVTTDGGILCWGSNGAGQLGDGTTAVRAAPVRVNSREAFAAVRTGQTHTCALTRGGNVHCWGGNTYGQLGSGTRDASPSPVAVTLPAPAAALAVGPYHSCAITRRGAAYCWGRNDEGQLGDGSTTHRETPTAVRLESSVTSLAAGAAHTCAVVSGGQVWCWGRNNYGQLGLAGFEEGSAVPRRVVAPASFTTVVAGSVHTCGRGRDGRVWCWGRNSYGQLGDGTTTDQPRPVEVPGVSSVVALDAGAAHTCAVERDGTTWCWGYNVDGQVGRGDRDNALAPARVVVPPR